MATFAVAISRFSVEAIRYRSGKLPSVQVGQNDQETSTTRTQLSDTQTALTMQVSSTDMASTLSQISLVQT